MADAGLLETMFLWRDAVLAALAGGMLLAYLGFYVVLSRNAFVSAAISQLAGLGVVTALLFGAHPETLGLPLLAAVVPGVAASVWLLSPRQLRASIPSDAVLAAIFVAASALSLVAGRFLSMDYRHVQATLFGDVVVASPRELTVVVVMGVLVGSVHWLFRQRFLLVIFDPETARAQGMAVGRWGVLLAVTIGLSIAVLTRTFGALTAFAFVVLPPVAGLLVARRFGAALMVAMVVAAAAAVGGYFTAFYADLPAGPTIVVYGVVALVPAALVARARRRAA